MLLVPLVSNNLSNYGRRHFKLFTNCHCFVGHPVVNVFFEIKLLKLYSCMDRKLKNKIANFDCLKFLSNFEI